jgi:hypothetical protein
MIWSTERCPLTYKIGGIFGVAAVAYYVGRWLGLKTKLDNKKQLDNDEIDIDGDLQPEL